MTGTPTYAQQLAAKARLAGVPDHCIDGLIRYIVDGVKPGTFLQAVLRDSLVDAASHADDINRHALLAYAHFLYSHTPRGCWGSAEAVQAWRGTAKMEADHGQV